MVLSVVSVAAPAAAATSTDVSLDPGTQTVDTGNTVTYDVVVETADNGVGAFDNITVSVNDTGVAEITNISTDVSSSANSGVESDGSSAWLNVPFGGDTNDTGSVTIVTVEVNATGEGTAALDLNVTGDISDEGGSLYNVQAVNDATFESAQPASNFQVSNFAAPNDALKGDEITVTADITNTGNDSGTKDVSYVFNGTVERTEQDVSLDPGETTSVAFDYQIPTGIDNGTYNHSVETADDSAGDEINITDQTGFISGRISDQFNRDVEFAIITVRDDDGDFVKNETTDNEGDYTVELAPGTYNVEVNREGYSTAEAKDLTVESDRTTTANMVIRQELLPTTIEVSPESDTAFVGESNEFTVTVRDQNGNPLEGVNVQAESDNNLVTVSPSQTTTDANGQATFTATSDSVADATLTFTADNGTNPDPQTTASKSFIQNGDGFIKGQVYDSSTGSGVENATVWAVLEDTYDQNKFVTTFNVSGLDDDDRVFVRVVDNETGKVLDPDDYDVRRANPDTTITRVDEFNTSDIAKGGGYAVFDDDGDGNVSIHHARIDNREYYLELSLDASNTDRMIVDDDGTESFSRNFTTNDSMYDGRVTWSAIGAGSVTTNSTGDGRVVFDPAASLNLSATQARAATSGANLWDMTDEDGDYDLTELYTDRQNGKTYVVIASGAGFTTDFADKVAYENGRTNGGETQEDLVFNLKPDEVEPEAVDVTQYGTHPQLSETGGAPNPQLIDEFADQTDDTYQRVPRDGTVDVIQVETFSELGEPIEGNVTVTIADSSFNGAFLSTVLGGTIVSDDDGDATLEVNTGADGEAKLLLESDSSAASLDTQKEATLSNNPAVSDTSNVTFVGVIEFRSASISGLVTDENNDLVPDSVVWADQFEFGADADSSSVGTQHEHRFSIDPVTGASYNTPEYAEAVDDPSDQFEITHLIYNNTSKSYDEVTSATVTAGDLDAYEFEEFAEISTTENFDLYDETTAEADYTLEPVPAVVSESGTVETQYQTFGVKIEEDFKGIVSNPGRASVIPQVTDDANIVLPINVSEDEGGLTGAPAEADTNDDGLISDSEQSAAISAWAAGDYSDSELSAIISVWAAS